MDTKQYWDELADMYQAVNATTDWLLGYPSVLKLFGDLNRRTILDYGCGNGRFTRYTARQYPLSRIIGVDTSQAAIDNALRRTETSLGIEYHHIITHEEVDAFEFDRVCANFVYCTIPNKETLQDLTQRIYNKLPDGGVFVLMDPHPETHGKKFTSFQSDEIHDEKSGDRVHVRLFTNSIDLEFDDYYWTRKDYEDVIKGAGFMITGVLEPIAVEYQDDKRLGEERHHPPFIIFKAVK
ncbi:MAG: class I SAM-dependent methyltransferase [Candidatus Kerfeldbacteria bacterium]